LAVLDDYVNSRFSNMSEKAKVAWSEMLEDMTLTLVRAFHYMRDF
jgi:hypothetical protein